jgi:hypothetical protein
MGLLLEKYLFRSEWAEFAILGKNLPLVSGPLSRDGPNLGPQKIRGPVRAALVAHLPARAWFPALPYPAGDRLLHPAPTCCAPLTVDITDDLMFVLQLSQQIPVDILLSLHLEENYLRSCYTSR